jgi:hypothetical protein
MRPPLLGIELCPTCNVVKPDGSVHGPIPENAIVFEWLFGPILPELRPYHWGTDDLWGVLVGVPERLAEVLSEAAHERYIEGTVLFPRAARYVMNDWCDFHGVREPTLPLGDFVKACERGWAGISHVSDVTFYCVDGARWMLFARDPDLLERMRKYHHSILRPRGIGLREKVDDTLD